ncbi:PaaX family transcriptional regulator C-terminal domain-containing protein [Psychromarinibacter sp. C21-152]|uniref:PaaX family transcriptional regulator C-terminal domain-containing protein n=1 Tax=Psychromarinibacter sediminicola TaxID=3033385 RepID=A0AAE3NTS4_9RHOB|nr:PaaX family transcriptional regulator C-terminal domain-containing protein [Psychromarinibacter sediminicola]MDF0600422.1 PaaX family transcriptional regulator C-terminal domain-containing protein [Psychromarinibacter sediminicola]
MPDTAPSDPADAIARRLRRTPPRASAFIVTIYGDVVEPRGGALWIGTLIECCADHGISESLVRTAVSRLVGAGRLVGDRVGRRSYYRLTAAAQAEFRAASRILFSPSPVPEGWLTAFATAPRAEGWPDGWARLSAQIALAPDRADIPRPDAVVLAGRSVAGRASLPALAAQHWPMDEVGAAYRAVVAEYAGIAAAGTPPLPPATALALRLRLVHDYRHAALADPRLPREAWPDDWQAEAARQLFLRLYLDLTEAADAHVGAAFRDAEGPLPARPDPIAARVDLLRAELGAVSGKRHGNEKSALQT